MEQTTLGLSSFREDIAKLEEKEALSPRMSKAWRRKIKKSLDKLDEAIFQKTATTNLQQMEKPNLLANKLDRFSAKMKV